MTNSIWSNKHIIIKMNFEFNRTIINWLRNRKTKLLMVGLSDSGKTEILKSLHYDEFIKEEKYGFFHLKTFEYMNFSMKIFDIGSAEDIFPIYRRFFEDVDGVVFVIDSNDRYKIDEARKYLFKFCDDEALKNAVFLIFSNKKHLACSMNIKDFQKKLEIKKIRQECKIFECYLFIREYLYMGLQWICEAIKNKDSQKN